MKTLLLLRHGKSSWANAELADFDRPLNERGERDAPRMGRLLDEQDLQPRLVLCSTALRAQQTLEHLRAAIELDCPVEFDERLYHAAPPLMLEVIREQATDEPRVLVVGHNPGMQELLYLLTGCDEDLPTAGLAVIELPIERWDALNERVAGKLANLFRPKELG